MNQSLVVAGREVEAPVRIETDVVRGIERNAVNLRDQCLVTAVQVDALHQSGLVAGSRLAVGPFHVDGPSGTRGQK